MIMVYKKRMKRTERNKSIHSFSKNSKEGLVVGLFPEQFNVSDPRLNKPVCHQQIEGGEITGSMLLQDLDTAIIDKNKKITYFCPNNIAILLSVNSKSLVEN
jgi:hypothetical protein